MNVENTQDNTFGVIGFLSVFCFIFPGLSMGMAIYANHLTDDLMKAGISGMVFYSLGLVPFALMSRKFPDGKELIKRTWIALFSLPLIILPAFMINATYGFVAFGLSYLIMLYFASSYKVPVE